jgi:4-aminobutyrate aminotransferase-like enzyme
VGLLVGLEARRVDGSPATTEVLRAIKVMLHRGYILLPEGEHANVISFTPPLIVSGKQLKNTICKLGQTLATLYPASKRAEANPNR